MHRMEFAPWKVLVCKSLFIHLLLVCGPAVMAQEISADVFYNKGNEAFENSQLDEALFNYEKALILEPHADDIYNNILVAQENLSVDIVPVEPFFLGAWWNGFAGLFNPGTWKVLTIACLCMIVLLMYVFFFGPYRFTKAWYKVGVIANVVLLFILIFAGITREAQIFSTDDAIIMGGVTQLREGPDPVSAQVKEVTGGVKVKILESAGDYYKLSATDKEQGWLEKSKVRRLKFEK